MELIKNLFLYLPGIHAAIGIISKAPEVLISA